VSLLAGVFSKHGVKKGDRVLIYMPMIPQAIAAMLASGIGFYKNSNPLRS
jgi:acyl-coenzyme A synthetase/AMP-(fatty) acid ligase